MIKKIKMEMKENTTSNLSSFNSGILFLKILYIFIYLATRLYWR